MTINTNIRWEGEDADALAALAKLNNRSCTAEAKTIVERHLARLREKAAKGVRK